MEVCKDLQPSQALLLFELIAYAWNNRQSRKEWFRDKNKSYSSCNQSYSSCNRRRGNKTGTGSSLTNYAPSKKEIKVCFYSNRKGGENLLVRPKKHTGQSSFINAAFVGVPFEGKKKLPCVRDYEVTFQYHRRTIILRTVRSIRRRYMYAERTYFF